MLVVSWPFCGVATTCGVALIGGEATAQPARPTSISNTMRRTIVRPSALSKDSTHTLTAGISPHSIRRNFAGWVTNRVPAFFPHRLHDGGSRQLSPGPVVRLPGWGPRIDAGRPPPYFEHPSDHLWCWVRQQSDLACTKRGRRLAQSRGERTLLQMRSHFRDHRGRHFARHRARTRVDSRQPLQLATQVHGVANYLFPHGIEPARRRAVRTSKDS